MLSHRIQPDGTAHLDANVKKMEVGRCHICWIELGGDKAVDGLNDSGNTVQAGALIASAQDWVPYSLASQRI